MRRGKEREYLCNGGALDWLDSCGVPHPHTETEPEPGFRAHAEPYPLKGMRDELSLGLPRHNTPCFAGPPSVLQCPSMHFSPTAYLFKKLVLFCRLPNLNPSLLSSVSPP